MERKPFCSYAFADSHPVLDASLHLSLFVYLRGPVCLRACVCMHVCLNACACVQVMKRAEKTEAEAIKVGECVGRCGCDVRVPDR